MKKEVKKESDMFIGKNFYGVVNELPNKGMRTKKTVFHKKIMIGKTEENDNVYLECTIEEIDLSTETVFSGKDHKIISLGNEKETINHEKITKYQTLSISGHSKHMGGQIQDEILNLKDIDKESLTKIKKIWEEWHLNDMHPNCVHQESFDCNTGDFTKKAKEQTDKCPLKYSYGSQWLIKPLPSNVAFRIIQLFQNYKTQN